VDFDQLAREVVEPGEPAYDRIVGYFGSQVVSEDGTLDRKALSDIVFRDMEKRKKLESFTHPAIFERFAERVNAIAARDPNAVIQVAVPLLLELNLQYMFHKILVVHIPAEEQVRRLAERDGISEEEAANILKAQLPIDEKRGYADFVVDNQGSLEATRQQVDALWQRLQDIQREGKEAR
jgi:dephospho-CoA kinase